MSHSERVFPCPGGVPIPPEGGRAPLFTGVHLQHQNMVSKLQALFHGLVWSNISITTATVKCLKSSAATTGAILPEKFKKKLGNIKLSGSRELPQSDL